MKKSLITQSKTAIALTTLILVLPGCKPLEWIKEKFKNNTSNNKTAVVEKKGEMVLALDGKTVITTDDFDAYLAKIEEANPQVKSFIAAMPEIKGRICDGLVATEIINHRAEKEKIRDREDFKKARELAIAELDKQLVQREFQEYLSKKIAISDEDIQTYFDKEKENNPRLIASAGGMKVKGIAFSSKKACDDFVAKTNKQTAQFKKIATTEKMKLEDLGIVNETNFNIDKNLKNTVIASKAEKAVLVSKAEDGTHWALLVDGKETTKYRSLAEVKEELKTTLFNERLQEMFMKEIDNLKVAYNAQESRSFLQPKVQLADIESDEVTDTKKHVVQKVA